ncbi:cyclopropane-fatty-acyl-phospholipid synthase-like [Bradysia coprophila]|uniref:cyclopropane-fatty-acyl-phospholipid synthase-like n=1 Tax=Bradysia coprophila TaxID=38358 RepID=UPI00187D7163|nr:cyclopropane-fatty-acyl-phospholipid synthase-like [Bradysia coprophila]XP_037030682.1 cyclopropane-fatty-acyl-phospholipid synthase-like [Bradysia coprophila]
MNPLINTLHVASLGAIRLWRTFMYIVAYIGLKPCKAFIIKLLNTSGAGPSGKAPHNIVIHNDWLFHRLMYDATLGFGEAYVEGWWDCEKLDEFYYKCFMADVYRKMLLPWDHLIYYLKFHAFNLQTLGRSREVADKHYDTGNHLFKSFLDKNMIYSCAYWKDAKNLDEAQLHKMDLICRKLKLKPGMRVLDLGCGWGGLCKFLAEKYNVEVVGVTNSKEGAEDARVRCKGLKVEIRVHDYREVNEVFDRIVIVGFFEHVGRKNYRSFFKLAHRCLTDDGIFLLHTIGHDNDSTPPMELFLEKYIFPNAIMPNHKDIPKAIDNLFCIEDWHNFGPDYDKTLVAWNDNFVKNWTTISHMYENPEATYRMWTYYFLMCAGLFRARRGQLWQIVLTKGLEGGYISVR